MPSITSAIDALLDTSTRLDSDANRISHASVALLAISRALPGEAKLDDVTINPSTGLLTLTLADADAATQLADRLDLPKQARVQVVDEHVVAHRWAGRWADWPVVLLHLEHDVAPAARAVAELGPLAPEASAL